MDGGMDFTQLVKNFQELGCKNEARCAVAARVYTDLIDVVGITNLNFIYDENVDAIILRGDDEKGPNVYLPWSNCEKIDFPYVENIQKKYCNEDIEGLTVGICDPSSTILYYKFTQGFKDL